VTGEAQRRADLFLGCSPILCFPFQFNADPSNSARPAAAQRATRRSDAEGDEQIDRPRRQPWPVDHCQRRDHLNTRRRNGAQAATSPGADSASSTVGGRVHGSNTRLILRDRSTMST